MKYNRHNKAFTLAEVILAIGIMGIGMVFAACLFPAAIKETESTNAAMEGAIIAQNGLTVARQMLTSANVGASIRQNPTAIGNGFVWIDGNVTSDNFSTTLPTSTFGLSGFYPSTNNLVNLPTVLPDTGFVLLLQRQGSTNEYLAISISYRKRKGGNIEVSSFNCNQSEDKSKIFTVTNSSYSSKFQKNGFVMVDVASGNPTAGKMARIVSRKDNEVTLEYPLTSGRLSNVIVISETGSQETPILSATSAILTIN